MSTVPKLSLQHKAIDGDQHIMLQWLDMCMASTQSSVLLEWRSKHMQMSTYMHFQYTKSVF